MKRTFPSQELAQLSSQWEKAVTDYLGAADLTAYQVQTLRQMKTTRSVVSDAVDVRNSKKPDEFVAAVSSAGTHDDLVQKSHSSRDQVPGVITNEVATLLRYSEGIDKFLDSLVNTCFAGAFVFGVVRLLLAVSVQDVKLLIAVKEKIGELNVRLCRMKIYLTLHHPSLSIMSMCVQVLGNVLRFCGLTTKFLKSLFKLACHC
jgi:hypothetical protein